MVLMVLSIFMQIVMRFLVSSPFIWSEEVTIYCFIWFLYLGASFAVRERAHIRMLSVIFLLPRRLRNLVLVASDLVWIVLAATLCVISYTLVSSMWGRAFYSPALGLHQKWPYLVLPVGFGLMLFRLLQIYWVWATTGRPPIDQMRGNE